MRFGQSKGRLKEKTKKTYEQSICYSEKIPRSLKLFQHAAGKPAILGADFAATGSLGIMLLIADTLYLMARGQLFVR